MLRVLAALTHAGATASLFVLMRQVYPRDAWSLLDTCVIGLVTVAILGVSWWRRRYDLDAGEVTLKEMISIGLVSGLFVAFVLIVSLAKWLISGYVSWLTGIVVLGVGGFLLVIGFAAAVSGALTGLLFQLLHRIPRRVGLIMGVLTSLVTIPLPAGMEIARYAMGMTAFEALMRGRYAFPIRVAVELSVDGVPISISRIVLCDRIPSRTERERLSRERRSPFHWRPGMKSFGHVFDDGSGVFVITPHLCAWHAPTQFRPPSSDRLADYRPLVGWTPDVSQFEQFELFVDDTAFDRPNAKVRLVSFEMTAVEKGTPISAPDAFAKIGWQRELQGKRFGAIYGVSIPQTEWAADAVLFDHLVSFTQPTFVPTDVLGRTPRDRDAPLRWLHSTHLTVERFMHTARNGGGVPKSHSWRWGRNIHRGAIIPLRRESQSWVAKTDEPGLLAFRLAQELPPRGAMPSSIQVDGSNVSGSRTPYVFDPTSRSLLLIFAIGFDLAEPNSGYASN